MLAPTRLAWLMSALVLFPLLLAGCGGGTTTTTSATPAQNSPVALAATYSGTETSGGVNAPVSASITQNGSQVTGSWGNEFGGLINIGTLTGTLTGNSLSATLSSSLPGQCSSTISATLNGSTITGNFSTTAGCATPQSGTFTLQSGASPPTVLGNASGNINDNIAGPGTITATIAQNGVALSGTFSDSFGVSGVFDGVIVGSTVHFNLVPTTPGVCPFYATGTLSGNSASGNYTAILCGTPDSGTFNITL